LSLSSSLSLHDALPMCGRRPYMNSAVTAPALSSTWTCAPDRFDRARVGVRASRFAAHHGAQHIHAAMTTPNICPSTRFPFSHQRLTGWEASIYVYIYMQVSHDLARKYLGVQLEIGACPSECARFRGALMAAPLCPGAAERRRADSRREIHATAPLRSPGAR